jgi:hypothetical protein
VGGTKAEEVKVGSGGRESRGTEGAKWSARKPGKQIREVEMGK